uniref:Uncharacterized protein n=1 Tax=Biomphalaria glabrata TaxID=6526 RepID=A0A2C9KMB1_BIOGL
MQETERVVPLDIAQLRKTQRRVAALLQSVRNSGDLSTGKHKRSSLTQAYNKLDPRHDQDKWGYSPRPPNPSAASRDSYGNTRENTYSDIRRLINTMKPSAQPDQGSSTLRTGLHDGQLLPPLTNGTSRVTSHVKRNTESDVNNGCLSSSRLPDVNLNERNDDVPSDSNASIDRLRFPEIDKAGSLVGTNNGPVGRGDNLKYKGSFSERMLSPIKDTPVERNFSFISEKTGGSLRMDEDYVPMQITITKLSDADQYGASDDHTGWTLDNSMKKLDGANSPSSSGSSSPINFMARLGSASWCTCARSDKATTPCPECRRIGGHEKWCVSASGLCQHCRKPVKRLGTRQRRLPEIRNNRGREEAEDEMSVFQIKNKSTSRIERQRQREQRDRSENELNRTSPGAQQNQRVRFEDESDKNQLKIQQPDVGANASDAFLGDTNHKKSMVAGKAKNPNDDQVVRIPKLGVNVHKTAYILALHDSMEQTAKKKSKVKDKKKHRLPQESETKGTVFSYFTLLKRPHSDPPHPLNIGIKQNFGAVVKDGMKHVFGSIKFADYYPGGKRWKELYES